MSRIDVVARHPELLEAWKNVAEEFDVFFGLENMHHALWKPALGAKRFFELYLRDVAAIGAQPRRPQEALGLAGRRAALSRPDVDLAVEADVA